MLSVWAMCQTKLAPKLPTIPVKKRTGEQPEQHHLAPDALAELIDQHIDADVNAGAHAVGGAELGHPDEQVDAQLLCPAQIDGEQPVIGASQSQVATISRRSGEPRRRRSTGSRRR